MQPLPQAYRSTFYFLSSRLTLHLSLSLLSHPFVFSDGLSDDVSERSCVQRLRVTGASVWKRGRCRVAELEETSDVLIMIRVRKSSGRDMSCHSARREILHHITSSTVPPSVTEIHTT